MTDDEQRIRPGRPAVRQEVRPRHSNTPIKAGS